MARANAKKSSSKGRAAVKTQPRPSAKKTAKSVPRPGPADLGWIPVRLRSFYREDYPRFSDAEMNRRRSEIERIMEAAKIEHMMICGSNRSGSAVPWLTAWPVTAEAIAVLSPGLPIALFVQYYNHVPLARRLARAEVEWGGESTIRRSVEELARRGAKVGRVGVIGTMTYTQHDILAARYGRAIDLNAAYARLRLVKSAEEIEWMRLGAAMSDRAIVALRDEMRPGMTEHDLADIVERSYVRWGGVNYIHFFGATSMDNPDLAVPRQFPSGRRLVKGDVVMAEISAHFWDYPGQVLRSFALGVDPPPLYRKLHRAADAALQAVLGVLKAGTSAAEVVEAAGVIEENGFTTLDDLVHGFGGGYLPPILGSKSRPAGPIPDFRFGPGMTIVVQPNVVTREGNAGVQTGELVQITEKGVERLHQAPRGFIRV